MGRNDSQSAAATLRAPQPWHLLTVLLLLAAVGMSGCQTVKPGDRALDGLRTWTLGSPSNRLSPAREAPQEKTAMGHWLERYLRGEYRVVDQRFVLSGPDFAKWAALESQAGQYMEQNLSAAYLRQGWEEQERLEKEWEDAGLNRVSLWKLSNGTPRYFALVMAREPLSSDDDRRLVGYFELTQLSNKGTAP